MGRLKPARGQAIINPHHPLARGLFEVFLFDEGGGNQILGNRTRTAGTFAADTNWAAGQGGWALEFDGSNDQVVCGNEPYWDGWQRGQHTFAAWFRIDGLPGVPTRLLGHALLTKGGGAPNGFQWGYNQVDLGVDFYTGSAHSASSLAITTGEWVHIASVLDEDNGQVHHYLNGIGESVAFTSWGGNNDATLEISGTGTQDQVNGAIESIWMWDRALTAADVALHYWDTYGVFEGWTRPAWTLAAAATPPGPTVFINATAETRMVNATARITAEDATPRIRIVPN